MLGKNVPVTPQEKKILETGLASIPVKQIGAERVAGYVLGMIREREKSSKHAFVLVPSTPWGIGLSLAACVLLLTGLFGIQSGFIKYNGVEATVSIPNIGNGISEKSQEERAKIDVAIQILDSAKVRLSEIAGTYRDSSSAFSIKEVNSLLGTIDSCRSILSEK